MQHSTRPFYGLSKLSIRHQRVRLLRLIMIRQHQLSASRLFRRMPPLKKPAIGMPVWVDPWPDLDITYVPGFDADNANAYLVEKMQFPKVSNPNDPDGRKIDNKTTIIYNPSITIAGIPERAHDYQLGSRSAIDWIVYSYQIKTNAAAGIVNYPNDWATEHDDPSYILDLIGRVVTVSMRTVGIIDGLPKLAL